MRKSVLGLVLTVLWLMACSDNGSSGEVVLRVDEYGNAFSPTELRGSVEYLHSMKPEAMRVIMLDDKLDPIDSVEVSVEKTSEGKFYANSRDYEYPYIKIVTVFPAENKKTMEFAQYVRLSKDNTKLKLNIYAALAAVRIEYLVKKKKKSFDESENQALEELKQIFDNNLESVSNGYYNEFYYANQLMGLTPFVFCRHEISDSVFYDDFKKFRSTFAEKGKIDSLWIVKAADAWLSTFEIFSNSVDYLFKSVSRDTVNGLIWLSEDFFERAYGIKLDADGSYDSVQIDNKASAFYGRTLLWTEYVNGYSMTRGWRLKSVLEDSLGACLADYAASIYDHAKSIQRNDTIYICRGKSHVWEILTDRDSLFNHLYGECSMNRNMGKLLYVHDSLFVCECEGDKCRWSDKYVDSVFTKDNAWYESVLDARAAAKYGECNYLTVGLDFPLDSVFVRCSDYKWKEIDSLNYYLGDCTDENKKGKHLGVYYSCEKNLFESDAGWREVNPPTYYNDDCVLDRVVEYDGTSYICKPRECEADTESLVGGCSIFRYWRELTDEDL